MSHTEVVVHANAGLLAAATAARLVTRLVDIQAAGAVPSVVLTGGSTGISVLQQLHAAPARDAVDWSAVELYWSDERFLPAGHPERNETQARDALLDHVAVDPARVHAMAAAGGQYGDDADAAADAYAALLAQQAKPEDHGPVPSFDICLLGVGEEGHVGSIFPHSPAVYETERTAVAVHGSPKPPPTRITLTLPAIRQSTEIWMITTGAAKGAAVALALGGAGEVALPAAGARAKRRTLWLLDRTAATRLPREFQPPVA